MSSLIKIFIALSRTHIHTQSHHPGMLIWGGLTHTHTLSLSLSIPSLIIVHCSYHSLLSSYLPAIHCQPSPLQAAGMSHRHRVHSYKRCIIHLQRSSYHISTFLNQTKYFHSFLLLPTHRQRGCWFICRCVVSSMSSKNKIKLPTSLPPTGHSFPTFLHPLTACPTGVNHYSNTNSRPFLNLQYTPHGLISISCPPPPLI